MILFHLLSMDELLNYDVDDSAGNIDLFYDVAGQLVSQSFFCHVDDIFLGLILGNIDGYINEKVMNKYQMGGTNYAPAINAIVDCSMNS